MPYFSIHTKALRYHMFHYFKIQLQLIITALGREGLNWRVPYTFLPQMMLVPYRYFWLPSEGTG